MLCMPLMFQKHAFIALKYMLSNQHALTVMVVSKRILGMRLVILTDAKHVLIYLKRMLIAQHAINYLMHMLSMSLKYKIQNPKYQAHQ
jgi:hypothetical protein